MSWEGHNTWTELNFLRFATQIYNFFNRWSTTAKGPGRFRGSSHLQSNVLDPRKISFFKLSNFSVVKLESYNMKMLTPLQGYSLLVWFFLFWFLDKFVSD